MTKTEFKLDFKTVDEDSKISVIIVAAGSASRMGGVDKQFLKIAGTPVIIRSINAFSQLEFIDNIVVVTKKESVLSVQNIIKEYGVSKVTDIVEGGDSRAQSVINGLTALPYDTGVVLIHDGARPLVTSEIIERVKSAAELYGAATCVVPLKDTVKIVDEMGKVVSTPKRSTLAAVQTPQGFKLSKLKSAIADFRGNLSEITDDCSFVELVGGEVYTVNGSYENIKITTKEDLPQAEEILKNRGQT